ncbi:MAG: SDR family oxidoreductase [Propionibacteriaceae bacterium]
MDLQNRSALVTGAGSGIGRAAAVRLAARGAAVAVVAHDLDSAAATVDLILAAGGTARPYAVEMGEPESIAQLYDDVADRFDELDVVVANAGINGVWAPISELTVEEWTRTLSVNLTGTFLTVKYAMPLMRAADRSSVIITSSVNGTRVFSNSGASAYSSSKAGQVAFAKMAAVELARDRIRVNVVCPGEIDTEIGDNTEHRHTEGLRVPVQFPSGKIPLTGEQPGTSDQVAELICFLASDAASHITGTEVWIDGAESLLVG